MIVMLLFPLDVQSVPFVPVRNVPALLLAVTHPMPVPKFRTGAKIVLISCFYFKNSVTVLNNN